MRYVQVWDFPSDFMRTLTGCLLGGALLLAPHVAHAYDRDRGEALRTLFGCEARSEELTLSPAQQERARALGGRAAAAVTRYRASCADPLGRSGYIVTRTVRTLPQTLLVLVRADATLDRVELLSFQEPAEYKGTGRWYRGFEGRRLDDDLNIQRSIPLMAGATITSRGTVQVVREVLALHGALADP